MGTKDTYKKPVVCQLSWLGVFGGIERYALGLSQELTARGIENFIAGGLSGKVKEYFDAANVEYHPLQRKASFVNIALYRSLHRLIIQKQVDVIHVHSFKHALIAAITCALYHSDVKVVVTRHSVKRGKGGLLYNWLYRRLHRLIFVSKLAYDEFATNTGIKTGPNMVVVHNGIRIPQPTQNINLRERCNLRHETQIIGFSGRIDPEKGVEVLLDAFAMIEQQNTVLVFVGQAEQQYKDLLIQKAQKLNIQNKIHFTGFQENVFSIINQFDIAVIPSLCRESFGLVVLEYMAAKVPIITTDNGAQIEIITNNISALTVEPNNAQMIAKKIDLLLGDKQLASKLTQNATIRLQDFNFNKFINAIITIYKN